MVLTQFDRLVLIGERTVCCDCHNHNGCVYFSPPPPAGIIGALDPYTHKVNTASLSGEGKLELEGVRPLRTNQTAAANIAASIMAGAWPCVWGDHELCVQWGGGR
jgi:hypothetical protein